LKAAAIFPMRLNQTSIAKAERPLAAAIVLRVIGRMVATVADVGGVPVAAGAIVDAVGAADGLVVAGGIVADAADRAEEDTRTSLPRICTDKT
jgi:hypothetical protein